MWHPNPEITALMNQACSMIATKEAAVPILDRVIELEPDYYEVNLAPVWFSVCAADMGPA